MKGGKLWLLLLGIGIVIYACFYDLIVGKGQIILGPKSYIAIGIGALLIIISICIRPKKKE